VEGNHCSGDKGRAILAFAAWTENSTPARLEIEACGTRRDMKVSNQTCPAAVYQELGPLAGGKPCCEQLSGRSDSFQWLVRIAF
jgi:hypothetical protein